MENVIGGAGMPKKKKIQRKSIDKTKTIPKTKASIEELQESRNGGQIALRGYSYQFLYSCYLMLSCKDENTVFNLEGIEDIDKIVSTSDEQKTMHIQLKYSENKQDASFMKSVLKNFLEAYLLDKNRALKLVYDFSVAKGHLSKLVNNILDSDELQYWKVTVDEIKNENPQWNWNQLDFDDFISKLSYENIKKAVLAERVEMALIENYDITTDNIKLFANSIKMFCFEKMETRSAVSLNDLKHQIELVKFDISKGAENPAHGWIEKVNFDELTDQESSYYEGKKATPMDIVKGLPVSRVLLEKDIRTSVNNYMVTVIKSSSGQGKTTLALKTQYGLQKEYTPYQLINCSDRGTLRHIVEYFHARIRLGEKPLILIDNLDAHLSEWNQLVQLMQSDVKYNYKILITSRENDWYNYAGDLSNIHSMNIIKPMLSKEEAAAIFNTLQKAGHIHPKIKDWKHAWNQIADKKLLIEYVYLLTHGEMIAERISSQMYEIGRNETGSIKFELLRQVCFADVCGIRLSTKKLLRSLAPRTVYDIGQILKSMADEFLVHISRDGDYIEGLHPVRSRHIVEYLHEYYPLEETAYNITKLADLQDFSVLFSHYPEFAFDKESFYSDVVNEWWNLEDLKCFVSAIRGTFSGCVMQYFRNNEELFNEANNQGGLFVMATEVCPFAQFREIDESVQTLEQMREIMPKNENIQYLLNLKDSIPAIDMTQTDIYILSMRLFKRLKDVNTKNVSDLDAYAMIADWLYNMDASMNLASNINLTDLWTRIEKYSIDTISLLMYTAYCGDKDIYSLFVSENLEMILSYLKRTTFSHKLYVDETETAIHVEYVLRASELQNGNQESVSRLNYICRTLPIYETYCSDAIMPKYDMLQPYRMPDDAHKEMPRRNLVIAFHKEFTSLWIKTIQSNYEFDSVSEWIEYWFQVRKCMYECLDKIGVYMYKALAGKRTGSTGTEFVKTRKKMDRMLCSTLSYPKEHRPFEEEVEVPKKFLEVKQAYFNSMQNFLRQVAGLIQRDENDVRLALYNLKQAKAGLPKMHKFFDGIELDEEMASKHTNLCRQESQKILEIYMCCQYFLQHDASPLFDKYQIRNWYRDVCTKEIEDVNVALDAMQQEYDAVFPDQAYEEAIFKHYPIILRSFDMTREEVMQDFVLRTIAFAETSFDYMLVLQCDENGAILQHAIKFPKRFFKAIQEALVSGEEITDTSLLTLYPIDVTEDMLECFSGDWKIKRQTDNPYVHYLGDIAEELWVYSKLRELLCTEEDREYCICELKKVAEKIAIMKKEIHLHLDEEVANQIDEMCNHVYEGNCFDNIRLNEFVQNLQYILV